WICRSCQADPRQAVIQANRASGTIEQQNWSYDNGKIAIALFGGSIMKWTIVTFGKYLGKSLPQILVLDPDWFFWMLPKLKGRLADEAQDLARKATAIKIPGPNGKNQRVEYRRQEGRPAGSDGFRFVDADSDRTDRWGMRSAYLDLSFV